MTSGVLCVLTDDDRRSSEELLSGNKINGYVSYFYFLFFLPSSIIIVWTKAVWLFMCPTFNVKGLLPCSVSDEDNH